MQFEFNVIFDFCKTYYTCYVFVKKASVLCFLKEDASDLESAASAQFYWFVSSVFDDSMNYHKEMKEYLVFGVLGFERCFAKRFASS